MDVSDFMSAGVREAGLRLIVGALMAKLGDDVTITREEMTGLVMEGRAMEISRSPEGDFRLRTVTLPTPEMN
jgi:hypothetical protein